MSSEVEQFSQREISIIAEFDNNEFFPSSYLRNNSRNAYGKPVKNIQCFPTCFHMKSGKHRKQGYCGHQVSVSFTSPVLSDSDSILNLQNAVFLGEFVPAVPSLSEMASITDRKYYHENEIPHLCAPSNKLYTFLGNVTSSTLRTHESSGMQVLSMKVTFNGEGKAYTYDYPGSRWSDVKHVFRVAILQKRDFGLECVGYCSSSEFKILSSRRNKTVESLYIKKTRCDTCHRMRACIANEDRCMCGQRIFSNSYAKECVISVSNPRAVFVSKSYLDDLYDAHKSFMNASSYICYETAIPFVDDWDYPKNVGDVDGFEWDISEEDISD
mmetsp:Transcript_33735/g.34362  ORF Transcript_33735/g.34362 Transcript_33735/m.34362 type:complete len:327 (+) Transcript_33735:75-1055(+)